MARDGGAAVIRGISPPRMTGPFANQFTTMLPQMREKFVSFHDDKLTSS